MTTDCASRGELSDVSWAWIGGALARQRVSFSSRRLGHFGHGHANAIALGIAQVHAHGLGGGPAIALANAVENALVRGNGVLRSVPAIGMAALADKETLAKGRPWPRRDSRERDCRWPARRLRESRSRKRENLPRPSHLRSRERCRPSPACPAGCFRWQRCRRGWRVWPRGLADCTSSERRTSMRSNRPLGSVRTREVRKSEKAEPSGSRTTARRPRDSSRSPRPARSLTASRTVRRLTE